MKKITSIIFALIIVIFISSSNSHADFQFVGKLYTYGDNLCGASTQEFCDILYVGKIWREPSSPYKKFVLIKYTNNGKLTGKAKLASDGTGTKGRKYATKSDPLVIRVWDQPRLSKKYTTIFHFSRK